MIEQSSCYVENVIVWAVMADILAVMVYGWYRMVKDDEYTFPFKLTSHDGLHRVHPRTTVYTIPHTYDGFLFIFTHDGSHAPLSPHAGLGSSPLCAGLSVLLNRRTGRYSDVFFVCVGEVSKSENGSYCYPAMTMDNIKKLRDL